MNDWKSLVTESKMYCILLEVKLWPGIAFIHLIRLGIRKEDLPKYEEELELKISKAQLQELKKDAIEAMETQKKRYGSNSDLPVLAVIILLLAWNSVSNSYLYLLGVFWGGRWDDVDLGPGKLFI